MTDVTNYKCPSCTGLLKINADTGKMVCEYCGSEFTVKEIEDMYAEVDQKAIANFKESDATSKEEFQDEWDASSAEKPWIEEGMRAYSCPSCGAELVCDETTTATCCPYCGNATIIPGQFQGVYKPDCLIPFRVTKEQAVAKLSDFYKGKRFLPSAFKSQNHITEIQGVYVPFWLFDSMVDADISYIAERSHTHRRGDDEITETDHYYIRRNGTIDFKMVPTDASSKMPDNYMDSVEPFDYSELKEFSSAYLSGYMAEKYDVTVEDSSNRADHRIANSTREVFRNSVVGYDSVMPQYERVTVHRGKVHYALLPVWMLSTKFKGENYLFAMNGQTGKFIGNLPVDKGKYWKSFFGIFLSGAAIMSLILILIKMFG